MAVTSQITAAWCSEPQLAPLYNGFIGDDWVFSFLFTNDGPSAILNNSTPTPQNMSAYTFSAKIVTPTTSTNVTGAVGTVDASQAANGVVVVTINDSYTVVQTPDIQSPDVPFDTTRSYYTRLLLQTTDSSNDTITQVIIPIRKVRP
jgi:hypothetical protein